LLKSLSTAFLADLEEDWRNHGKEIFPILRAKYPQAYFQGIVSLARIIRWDVDPTMPLIARFRRDHGQAGAADWPSGSQAVRAIPTQGEQTAGLAAGAKHHEPGRVMKLDVDPTSSLEAAFIADL
jgi:hypothetical protein